MENSKEENVAFLDRTSRATRGKRMTRLLDDELEEDELFWNQEALKDEENDIEYEEEGEAVDVFDSDFDEDEPEPDDEGEKEPDERERTKKRLIPPGRPSAKKKKKKKNLTKSEKEPQENEEAPDQSTPSEHHDAHDDTEAERTIRKSTRTAVIVKQAEREAICAAMQATKKPIKRKKEGEEKKMTQEEMLLEAAQTEVMNLRNLERVLAREEEVKKKAIVHKAVYTGPQIRYISTNGSTYLEFVNGASFSKQISTTSPPYPQKAVCAVTGLPARYRDPKTGLPYATKEAFKIIRQRFADESSRAREEKHNDELSQAISGQGFTLRRKRSTIQNSRQTPYSRAFARFRKFPADDIISVDSE
ncbi:SWR1 complex subunit 2 isoform X1 [Lycium barbarum]|uniref:SWR1 complex subunit 2 isoform X1 n=1 Tax=Lycium barbarum TaxID=112863 RepID=UPI00293EDCB7|nr:SWR1 complex subunit 2 isoform X1 [Lycium barbarum]